MSFGIAIALFCLNYKNEMGQEMKKMILIVTGNNDFRAHLETYLSGSFEVKMAENAIEAYSLLENGFIPELIITEFVISLPGGKRLIIKLKESRKYIHIPILVISGSDKTIARLDLIRTGHVGHIVKPFSLTDLETRIKILLNVGVLSAII
jgi:DNA-binding response OmpR family regulator